MVTRASVVLHRGQVLRRHGVGETKVHEIASTAGVDSKFVLKLLKEMGEYVKGPSSSLQPAVARRVVEVLKARGYPDPDALIGRRSRLSPDGIETIRTGLRREDATHLLEMIPRFPRSLPAALRVVAESWTSSSARAGTLLREALTDGYFAYALSTTSHRTREAPLELPAPSGAMVLAEAGERWKLIFWSTSDERTVTISRSGLWVREGRNGDPRRVASLPVEFERLAVHEGILSERHASESELSADLLSVCGMREAARERAVSAGSRRGRASDAPAREVRQRPVADDGGVSVVYLSEPGGETIPGKQGMPRSSRWSVRGHWRNQWYPSEKNHHRVWITEHHAGRDDAPVKGRDVVYVARFAEN